MSEGITSNQLETGVVTIFSQSVTLNDAQIKALPSVPIVIVPATQVLNYSGLPTQLFLPIAFIVSSNTLAGAYTNVTSGGFIALAIGSDWSLNAMEVDQHEMTNLETAVRNVGICNSYVKDLTDNMIVPCLITNNGIQDNALAIALNNTGNLTGGNAANSMKVTVLYTIIDV